MNPQQPPITDPEKLDEEISAYLDGELSGDQLREVEQRMASDDRYRDRLQAMDRSWNLLDELPRDEVDQRFAATTVEMVAATAQVDDSSDNWGRQLLRQWTIGGFSVLAACITGFLVTTGVAALLQSTGLVENPNGQLLNDLPIVEDLDKYQLVEDIAFLRDFSQLPDVAGAARNSVLEATAAKRLQQRDETIEDRRARVEQLADPNKRRLATNLERFTELKPEQQQQLRALYAQLNSDPQADTLLAALDSYHEWYRQLTPVQHVELRVREGDARIAYIAKLRDDQQAALADRQMILDAQTIGSWIQDLAVEHEDELLSQRPDVLRQEVHKLPESQKRLRLTMILWQSWMRSEGPLDPAFDEAKYLEMKTQLSQGLRDRLDEKEGSAAQVELLMQMFSERIRKRLANLGGRIPSDVAGGRGALAADTEVSRERLMEFFKRMPPEHQQRMMHMSREDFMSQLRELYQRHGDRPGGGRPPFRRPRGADGKDRPRGPAHRPPGDPTDHGGFRSKGRDFDPEDDRPRPPERPRPGDEPPRGDRPPPPQS